MHEAIISTAILLLFAVALVVALSKRGVIRFRFPRGNGKSMYDRVFRNPLFELSAVITGTVWFVKWGWEWCLIYYAMLSAVILLSAVVLGVTDAVISYRNHKRGIC